MKLLTKTSLLYLAFAIPVMVICSVICYKLVYNEIIESTDEALMKDFLRHKECLKGNYFSTPTGFSPEEMIVTPSKVKYTDITYTYSDTIMYDKYEKELLPFRILNVQYPSPLASYDIIESKSYLESDDLMDGIITSVGIMFGLLLIGFFSINYFVYKNLWTPFYKTLDVLKKFDLNKKETITFPSVNTSEFEILNEELGKMTAKIQSDYSSLKEFTENASHEIQTPLAIIRSKLELMAQSENLSAEQMKQVQEIYESVNRLSKLNQSLLLLTKIENRQFHEIQTLDLNMIVEKKLNQLEELIGLKGIKVEKHAGKSFNIKMNTQLADILLSNILSNAIRHNIQGGKIIVEIKNNSLALSNSGNPLQIPSEKLFERFQKGAASLESVGLGLSIVKQICDSYNFKVHYSYEKSIHTISILF